MKHAGSCHCGRIRFEAEGDIDQGLSCNCSICSRKGALLCFLPRPSFRLLTSEDAASTYTFNKHIIKHRFCPTCGIHTHGEGKDRSGNPIAAVNLRCVEKLDLKKLKIVEFDGRAL